MVLLLVFAGVFLACFTFLILQEPGEAGEGSWLRRLALLGMAASVVGIMATIFMSIAL